MRVFLPRVYRRQQAILSANDNIVKGDVWPTGVKRRSKGEGTMGTKERVAVFASNFEQLKIKRDVLVSLLT